ncbi:hypothetical protein PR048_007857 [Dryococelus australis]|uniref:Uncharacterized protein n=1 Tax=Dryococelus australis TaxID=614101 RepID=A0ABQ9HVU0_9NEOP|nr:hypothetical protein PR048_007857 [Dryococelus australis]
MVEGYTMLMQVDLQQGFLKRSVSREQPMLRMINFTKEFINAERSGDWSAHIDCVKRTVSYFNASDHFPYAKYSQLYVQDMIDLSSKMIADEYHKFTKCGYFKMRSSDRYWSGVWSDMTTKTKLMRSFKINTGLTRGQGISDRVISKWKNSVAFSSPHLSNMSILV